MTTNQTLAQSEQLIFLRNRNSTYVCQRIRARFVSLSYVYSQNKSNKYKWLFKGLNLYYIHLDSRSVSAIIYPKVMRWGLRINKAFKESYSFFTTKHLVVNNPTSSLLPNIW